jgi:hypothetical protein
VEVEKMRKIELKEKFVIRVRETYKKNLGADEMKQRQVELESSEAARHEVRVTLKTIALFKKPNCMYYCQEWALT